MFSYGSVLPKASTQTTISLHERYCNANPGNIFTSKSFDIFETNASLGPNASLTVYVCFVTCCRAHKYPQKSSKEEKTVMQNEAISIKVLNKVNVIARLR